MNSQEKEGLLCFFKDKICMASKGQAAVYYI